MLIEGEPGIGKSALLAAGIEGAAGLGCRVLRGVVDEFVGRFPLRVLLDCFAGYEGGEVAALVRGEWGGVAGGGDDPVPGRRWSGCSRRWTSCAPSRRWCWRSMILQWADEASLTVWGQLSRRASQLPLLLVGASRPAPQRAELAGLRRLVELHGGVLIGLGPLDGRGDLGAGG